MTLGEKLNLLRKESGYTMEKLCELFNKQFRDLTPIKRTAYNNWELDQRDPQLAYFKALCLFFNVEPGSMLFDDQRPARRRTPPPKPGKRAT